MLAMYALLALIPVTLAVQATQGVLEDPSSQPGFVVPPTWRVSSGRHLEAQFEWTEI